jgi:hypothetical protein
MSGGEVRGGGVACALGLRSVAKGTVRSGAMGEVRCER